jgi:hypothetical protein
VNVILVSTALFATLLAIFFLYGVGKFAALDCVDALESSKCWSLMRFYFSAGALLIAVWLGTIGIVRRRGRLYWSMTALAGAGLIAMILLS